MLRYSCKHRDVSLCAEAMQPGLRQVPCRHDCAPPARVPGQVLGVCALPIFAVPSFGIILPSSPASQNYLD